MHALLERLDRYLRAADEGVGRMGPLIFISALVAIALVFGDDIISAFRQH